MSKLKYGSCTNIIKTNLIVRNLNDPSIIYGRNLNNHKQAFDLMSSFLKKDTEYADINFEIFNEDTKKTEWFGDSWKLGYEFKKLGDIDKQTQMSEVNGKRIIPETIYALL